MRKSLKPPKPEKFTKEEQAVVERLEAAATTYKPHKVWTEADEVLLKRFYGRVPDKMLEAELHCSYSSLVTKASELGVKKR